MKYTSTCLKKNLLVAFLLVSALALTNSLKSQNTYTWAGANNASWTVATNWSPNRINPATNDILQFNDGGTYTITNVPAQTISQLLLSNSTNVTLTGTAANQITIAGTTGLTNVNIGSGSTLTLGGSYGLIIATATTSGQKIDISGNLILTIGSLSTATIATTLTASGNITIGTSGLTTALNLTNATATISGNITINPGGTLTTATTLTTITGTLSNNGGTPTTTIATLKFEAGSNYNHICNGGTIPPASWNLTSTCNITGITTTNPTGLNTAYTYGNFIWNSPGTGTLGITNNIIAGNLTVSQGLINFNGLILNVQGNVIK